MDDVLVRSDSGNSICGNLLAQNSLRNDVGGQNGINGYKIWSNELLLLKVVNSGDDARSIMLDGCA